MSLPSNEAELYTTVGEIRSDVKTLLAQTSKQDGRISSLEKKIWIAGGAAGMIGMFIPAAVARAFGIFH